MIRLGALCSIDSSINFIEGTAVGTCFDAITSIDSLTDTPDATCMEIIDAYTLVVVEPEYQIIDKKA